MRRLDVLPVLVLPVALLAFMAVFQDRAMPYWQWFAYDSSYFYLLNGLDVALGISPPDFHHPGTTTQTLVGLVLRLAHLGASSEQLTEAVLDDPEGHLRLAGLVHFVLMAGALLAAGLAALRSFGSALPAVLVQLSPILSAVIIKSAHKVSPESTLLAAEMLMVAGLLVAVRRSSPSRAVMVALGALAGFLAVTKLHSLPLALVPLFVAGSRRRAAEYLAACVLGGLVFLAPALPHVGEMAGWFWRMATHSGAYGQGEAGLLPPGYVLNLLFVFHRPLYTAPLVAGGMVLWLRRGRLEEAERPFARLFLGIAAAQLVSAMMVAKAPGADARYMVPAFLLSGTAMALVFALGRPLFAARRAFYLGGWALVAAAVAVSQGFSVHKLVHETLRAKREVETRRVAQFQRCSKVYFFPSSSQDNALAIANRMAGFGFSAQLQRRLPANSWYWWVLDYADDLLPRRADGTSAALKDIVASGECTVFRGGWGVEYMEMIRKDLPNAQFRTCAAGGDEYIFTLGVTCDGRAG